MSETAKVKIQGMSCGHCVMRIEKAVGGMKGVGAAKVDLAAAEGTFTFEPGVVSLEQIKAKIADLGFKA